MTNLKWKWKMKLFVLAKSSHLSPILIYNPHLYVADGPFCFEVFVREII
jgi:hypothetical protein